MGIVNVTPDSFSDGGRVSSPDAAADLAQRMVDDGADILDIGGESTRPGAQIVPVGEEIARTAPVIAAIRARGITTPISIDTRKAAVAQAALQAGATMVNDVSALTFDSDMARVVARAGVPLCLMHAQGTPQTMQQNPVYADVVAEVIDWLRARMDYAVAQGIARGALVVDPGIGFGKSLDHNVTLLRDLDALQVLGAPVLLGASRKSMIGAITGVERADQRLAGSLAVALHGATKGARIVRVHDVAQTVQALALWRAVQKEIS